MKQTTEKHQHKTLLITGASGLIGQLIYQQLSKFPEQYSVFATDNHRQYSERFHMEQKADADHPMPKFKTGQFIAADITDKEAVAKVFAEAKFDVVIHLAGVLENSGLDVIQKVNVEGAQNIMEACVANGVRRVVLASTIMIMSDYFKKRPYIPLAFHFLVFQAA